MEYRVLGETDVKVSAITFGAWAIGGWMWGGADRNDAVRAIRAAYNEGVTSIDTAPIYGMGVSEEIVAEAISGIPRDKVQILTKFGMRWDVKEGDFVMKSKDNYGNEIDIYKLASKQSIIKECEDSLRRLKTDYIDLMQLHWPDVTTPISETMEAMEMLLQQGKIRAAGVCNYNVDQMKEANQTLKLASDQVSYSMIYRDIEQELVPYCIENKQSVIAYSPLQRGLLTGKIKPGHQFGEGDTREGNRFYTEDNIIKTNKFLDSIRPLAEVKSATLGQLVLRWTIDQPGITVALAGARNEEQAVQNARAINVKLSNEELLFISTKLKEHGF
ncbi:aldo/keto reductase [Pseudoflavitalea sp. G-6-1-2]|uniref:aldo/keto reductase n=1 Tax=Pseudoflavitalea sp. G-6-1-2 TaxID=2728841 RepID=UPI00146EB4D2|nr:aldo/keto reductase [Pseudoflavitalea sp. G-6-1-2]NML23267.1 aldo/keto reductase [Pseudoflavitalea sp. G-6-1-2]